jgi:hypothetical protein
MNTLAVRFLSLLLATEAILILGRPTCKGK